MTDSFASRAETLLNRFAKIQAQREDEAARTTVEIARARAGRSRETLSEVLRVTPGLVRRGVTPPPVPEAERREVAKARQALRATASAIVGVQLGDIASRIRSQSVHHALDVADKLAKSMTANLNRSVEKRRQALISEGIDRPIVSYPGVSLVLVTRLQRVQRRLQSKVEGLNAGQLEQRLDEILRDAETWTTDRQLLDKGLENQHPDIQAFLRQATTEDGAPWTLVTPTVSNWLANPENTSSLRIVLRS